MIIVDAGVLYALADRDDDHHEKCTSWMATARGPFLIPTPALGEACYLIGTRCGPNVEALFLESCGADKTFQVAELLDEDFPRMAELVRSYGDMPLGGADASIIAIAERLRITEVASVDRRHFTVVRPNRMAAFRIHPE